MHRLLFGLLLPACVTSAFDGMGLELGRSRPSAARLVRVHIIKDWRAWELGSRWQAVSYWEGQLGYWDNESSGPDTPDVWELAVAPVVRLQPRSADKVTPYLEFASGPRLISEKLVNERRELGGHFQFGSHLGFGLRFGERQRYDLSVRVQHISNARIKQPNDGINFASMRFVYRF
jgi:hypothetical protein